MKILFSASPARGHIYPLLPLLRAAQHDGHDVVLATAEDLVPELEGAGIRTWTAGPTFAAAVAAYLAVETNLAELEPDERIRRDLVGLFARPARARAADLLPMAAAWKPDLVVSELTELAAPVIAAVTGAAHVLHGLGQTPALFREPMAEAMRSVGEPLGVPDIAGRTFGQTYLDIVPPSLRPQRGMVWRRQLTVRPTDGEVRPSDSLPPEFSRLLDRPLAYLTMGTLFNEQPEIFRESIAGLRAVGLNVIVTVGPGADPEALGTQSRDVLVVPFVPQALVLPHVALVVHHGGAGTTLGSFVHGLPQVIAPQGADQFMNAASATEAGAALTLPPGTVTAESVAAAATRILDDHTLRDAAGKIRAEIAAMPGAESVLAELVQLVDAEQLAA